MFYDIIEKKICFFLAIDKTRRHNGFIQIAVFKISTTGI